MEKLRSKYYKVKCDDCGSEQVVFGSAASKIKCLACGRVLVEPKGGKAKILSKEIKPLE